MFSASAELYDRAYSGSKDYAAEAAVIAATIRLANPNAKRMLASVVVAGRGAERVEAILRELEGRGADAAFFLSVEESCAWSRCGCGSRPA